MVQVGYHNGARFYPLDFGFHTSANLKDGRIRDLDKRCCGWKRCMEFFEKKTDLMVTMLKRCWQNNLSARFVLFDSWFASDAVISQIMTIGYGVICRLKNATGSVIPSKALLKPWCSFGMTWPGTNCAESTPGGLSPCSRRVAPFRERGSCLCPPEQENMARVPLYGNQFGSCRNPHLLFTSLGDRMLLPRLQATPGAG